MHTERQTSNVNWHCGKVVTIAKYARDRAGVICRRTPLRRDIRERARRNATRRATNFSGAAHALKARRRNTAAKAKGMSN